MWALFATAINLGRKMENAKQLMKTFFKKYFGMFNTSGTYYNG